MKGLTRLSSFYFKVNKIQGIITGAWMSKITRSNPYILIIGLLFAVFNKKNKTL